MAEIRKQDEALKWDALSSCRVHWVDERNAECMIDRPECRFLTPFGGFCEHPHVVLFRDDELDS